PRAKAVLGHVIPQLVEKVDSGLTGTRPPSGGISVLTVLRDSPSRARPRLERLLLLALLTKIGCALTLVRFECPHEGFTVPGIRLTLALDRVPLRRYPLDQLQSLRTVLRVSLLEHETAEPACVTDDCL